MNNAEKKKFDEISDVAKDAIKISDKLVKMVDIRDQQIANLKKIISLQQHQIRLMKLQLM